jgi:hypothetical protein
MNRFLSSLAASPSLRQRTQRLKNLHKPAACPISHGPACLLTHPPPCSTIDFERTPRLDCASDVKILGKSKASALCLPAFFSRKGANSFDHYLQFSPATPQREPAGATVAFAVLVTAEAAEGQEE